jgi:cell division cycle protein 20 (cofactor of APC complex)
MSPTKRKTLSIMRHCSSSLNKTASSLNPSASARFHMQAKPDLVLDAPNLFDDFYSRPVDWSCGDHIAAATDKSLNIRDMKTLKVTVIRTRGGLRSTGMQPAISSIKFHPREARHIAVGFLEGHVELWNWERMRTYFVHKAEEYIGGLSWRPPKSDLLSVCYKDGIIRHFDPRSGPFPVHIHLAHSNRGTGLAWNEDGTVLASLGEEDGIKCWDARTRKEIPLMGGPPYSQLSLEERWHVKHKTITMKVSFLQRMFICKGN